ncbi:hypothetical protein ACWX0P_00335 [Vibrio mediterranei]
MMLAIIFAKTASVEPTQCVGPTLIADVVIKQIRHYGHVEAETLFAALVESSNGTFPCHLSHSFDVFKIHKPQLRRSTELPDMASSTPNKACLRHRQRHRQRERKCQLTEGTWTRFIKRKHLLDAYEHFSNHTKPH